MQNLDPSYLRYIYDSLEKGSIHAENASELPDGLIGLYEETFDDHLPVLKRQYIFRIFTLFALLKKEVSISFITEVLEDSEANISDFISTYSSWFNSPESGKYQLYHERLKVYILQKLSDREIQAIILRLIDFLLKENTEEIKSFSKEWLGFYLLSVGKIESGLEFLISNCLQQKENWWESTFELYCIHIFTDSNYVISEAEINFYAQIKSRQFCTTAAKLVVRNFERIAWEEFVVDSTSETRFHYVLAGILNQRFNDLPKELIYQIILSETHYLSYVMAYAWKYNCWAREEVPYPELVDKIKKNGSPYLRILLRQIDGGRLMLNKKPILDSIDYKNDCWEYVTEDFIEVINIGKERLLKKYLTDFEFCLSLKKMNLDFVLNEFNSLHVQIARLQNVKNIIQKSPYFFQIIEILWFHPAWEIGDIGNDLVRNKLNNPKEKSIIEQCIDWIYRLSKERSTYSISILIFDIIEVADVSDQFVKDIIEIILSWRNAQIRGQFIASANSFFVDNKESRWLELIKSELLKLCNLASDIWETQEIIELLKTLNDRLTNDEINLYISHHKLLNKIPNALQVDWDIFWETAERMRLRGEI
jgi:hypothetical protein